MSSLLDLFSVLDGWDPSYTSEGIRINPDPAIAAARRALAGRRDDPEALRQIEEQISKVRSILRGIRFGLIESVQSELGTSPEKMVGLAVELHQLAALLLMRRKDWERARDHLIRAVACRPDDPDPRFRLVGIYLETAAYEDAYNLLQTVNDSAGELPEGAFQLDHLTRDIQLREALAEARSCYEMLIRRHATDPFAELARRQIANIDDGHAGPAPTEEIEAVYHEGVSQDTTIRHSNGRHP